MNETIVQVSVMRIMKRSKIYIYMLYMLYALLAASCCFHCSPLSAPPAETNRGRNIKLLGQRSAAPRPFMPTDNVPEPRSLSVWWTHNTEF